MSMTADTRSLLPAAAAALISCSTSSAASLRFSYSCGVVGGHKEGACRFMRCSGAAE